MSWRAHVWYICDSHKILYQIHLGLWDLRSICDRLKDLVHLPIQRKKFPLVDFEMSTRWFCWFHSSNLWSQRVEFIKTNRWNFKFNPWVSQNQRVGLTNSTRWAFLSMVVNSTALTYHVLRCSSENNHIKSGDKLFITCCEVLSKCQHSKSTRKTLQQPAKCRSMFNPPLIKDWDSCVFVYL